MLTRFLFNGELDRPARSIVAAAGVALFLALALPLWQMTMVSNQYPEGLRAIIYTYKLEGDLQEINTLNHYIGMQALNEDFFPELKILPLSFAIGGLLCGLAALWPRRWLTTLVLFGGGLSGLVTMSILIYRLYTYGHNLSPRAPIKIPPFMPPPIGVNQLANFQVTTYFHAGSVLFLASLVALGVALWISRSYQAPNSRTVARPGQFARRDV